MRITKAEDHGTHGVITYKEDSLLFRVVLASCMVGIPLGLALTMWYFI